MFGRLVINSRRNSLGTRKPTPRRSRPSAEPLEARWVPAVTNPGSPVLSSVEVQALYYGSDWNNDSVSSLTRQNLEKFLSYIVQSPYMNLLNQYGAGKGTFQSGVTIPDVVPRSTLLSSDQIVGALRKAVPDPSNGKHLYVFFVEPYVTVDGPQHKKTSTEFTGFHSVFMAFP